MEPLPSGTLIDRYVIDSVLGEGGFGIVYRARHTVVGRAVALKVLRSDRFDVQSLERFLREARAAALVGGPHSVQIFDSGVSGVHAFIAMELLQGEDLKQRLQRAIPNHGEAAEILQQVLRGLAAAHEKGIVHRDLKPANIFLSKSEDKTLLVKLLDFGMSKVLDAEGQPLTRAGMLIGTPHYMAPEQLIDSQQVDRRADLFSAAAVFYEMVTGRIPYPATDIADLFRRVRSDRVAPLCTLAPAISPLLGQVIDRGLARDPDARWQNATEFGHALRAASENVPLTADAQTARLGAQPEISVSAPAAVGIADTPAPMEGLPRGERRGGLVALAIVAVVGALGAAVVVIVGLNWLMDRPDSATPPPTSVPDGSLVDRMDPPKPITQSAEGEPSSTDPKPVPSGGRRRDPDPPSDPDRRDPDPRGEGEPELGAQRVRVSSPRIVGTLNPDAVDSVIRRARPALDRCRSGVEQRVFIQFFVQPGRIGLVQADPNQARGDREATECAVNAFQGVRTIDDSSSGIVSVSITLPPR